MIYVASRATMFLLLLSVLYGCTGSVSSSYISGYVIDAVIAKLAAGAFVFLRWSKSTGIMEPK